MPRSTTFAAAVLVLAVAAGVAWWAAAQSTSARPLHFWIRADDPKPQLYASRGGPAISSWLAARRRGDDGSDGDPRARISCCEVAPSGFASIFAAAGLLPVSSAAIDARVITPVGEEKDGWLECLVDTGSWPVDATVDERLVGVWEESTRGTPTGTSRELHADGKMSTSWTTASPFRWGVVGDVLMFGSPTAAYPGGQIIEAALVLEDGATYRTTGNWIGRKTR